MPIEWQEQSSLDELADFLQLNWEQRSVFYDDGKIKRYVYYYCESNGFAQLEEEFYNYNGDFTEVISSDLIIYGTSYNRKNGIYKQPLPISKSLLKKDLLSDLFLLLDVSIAHWVTNKAFKTSSLHKKILKVIIQALTIALILPTLICFLLLK